MKSRIVYQASLAAPSRLLEPFEELVFGLPQLKYDQKYSYLIL